MFKLITLICLAVALALWIILSGYEKEDFSMFVERRYGKMVKADSVSDKGVTIRAQLFDIARYKPERVVKFSCKSAITTEPTNREQGSNSTAFSPPTDSDGWLTWMAAQYGPFAGSSEPPAEGVPLDRVHIITPEFAYVAMGPGEVVMTFDACKTKVTLSAVHFSYGMFTRDELKGIGAFPNIAPPIFSSHSLASDGNSVCFRINPEYVNSPNKGFDVCSMNRGITWYAKEARGLLAPPAPDDVSNIYSSAPVQYKFEDRERLFPNKEIAAERVKGNPLFFSEHRFTADTSGICSRINTIWLADAKKGVDVCTADNGATWYTKEVNGLLMPPSSEDAAMVYSATTATPTFVAPTKPVETLRNDALGTSKPVRSDASKPIKADR